MELSERRVQEVQQYLVDHGVNEDQIVADAFGESRPLKDVASVENYFFDRRVLMQFSFDVESHLAGR